MSDYVSNTSQWEAGYKAYTDEFRCLMLHIFTDDLSNCEVKSVHWYLNFPKRFLDEPCFSEAVLRCLEERNFLKNWMKNPQSCKWFLDTVLKRMDLGDKVQELAGILSS